ncbi:hypothetical protein [Paractinoplanes maris]|uniref:hypothetical protein n=1 Tax=Paractinoplanes maris TaxID=1734446 RepID=UPI002021263D|nr:hypothetical protein [Actinoplanes maris]
MPIVGAVESRDQLVAVWSRIVAARGGRPAGDDGAGPLWAGSPFGFFNALTLSGDDIPAEELSEELVRADAFLRARPEDGYLWVFEDLLSPRARAELADRASEAGLEIAFTGWGMDGELSPAEPHHAGLQFRRVETEDDLRTFGELNALAYDMPPAVGHEAFAGSRLWLDEAYAWLGYRNGQAVTCGAAIPSAGSLVVAFVATLREESRRGFGQAAARQVIAEGTRATGHRRVVLHTTVAGRPVYERIGLRPATAIHFLQPTGADDSFGD